MERRKSRSPKRYVYGAKDSFKKKRSPKKRSRSRRNKSLRPKRSHRHRSRSNASNKKMIRKSRSPKRHVYSSHKKKSGPKRSSRHRSRRLRSNRVSRRGVSRRVSRRLSEYSPKNRSKFSYVSSLKSKISPRLKDVKKRVGLRLKNVKKRVGLRLSAIIAFIKKIARNLFRNKHGNKNIIVDDHCKKIFERYNIHSYDAFLDYIDTLDNTTLINLSKDLLDCLQKYNLPEINPSVFQKQKQKQQDLENLIQQLISKKALEAENKAQLQEKGLMNMTRSAEIEKTKKRLKSQLSSKKISKTDTIVVKGKTVPVKTVENQLKKLAKKENIKAKQGLTLLNEVTIAENVLESTKNLEDKLNTLLSILKKHDHPTYQS